MWPLLSMCFHIPRRHVHKDLADGLHIVDGVTAVDQGCQSASLLPSMGIIGVHKALGEHSVVAGLQDDTYLLSSQENIKMTLESAAPASNKAGCMLELRKCGVWSPGCVPLVIQAFGSCPNRHSS